MDWQMGVVGLAVAGALAYLGRGAWRTWAGRGAGCGGCKCGGARPGAAGEDASPRPLIPVEELTLRPRRHVSGGPGPQPPARRTQPGPTPDT